MQNVLETGKRALSVAVAAATIMFSVGASLLTPSTAEAASAGDLIKGTSLTTVYYYGHDGSRYTFPNVKTYETWFPDFSGVMTISDSALADIPLAGNVVYRPGSYWVKIQSDAKVYAVSTDGTLHWIESETVATDFAGASWNQRIQDIPDVFFTDYSVGTSLMDAEAFDGALFMDGGSYYIAMDGEKRELSSAGRTANNLQSKFFMSGTGIDDSGLSSGSTITGEVASIVDPAQTVEDDDVVTGGDLSISEASSNPAATSLPKGAVGVEFMSFDVEAGDEDGTLNSVTLSLSGLSDTAAVGNVYLYEGVTRLTDARTVNSSTRQLTFGSLNLDVDAGDTRTLTVRADVGASAATSNIASFSIESSDDVDATGTVGGRFPVDGNTMTIASVTVGTINLEKSGTIENPSIGEDDAVIGEFKITANTEDASIEALTLKIDDSDDHDDFKLWVDGEVVAEGEDTGDNLVAFDLTGSSAIEIVEGRNETFNVSADIGGENNDDVKVYLDNDIDVIAVGGDYGFGMSVGTNTYDAADAGTCTTTSHECSFSDVEGGDVTFVFEGPAASDIEIDSQDQTLLEFSLTAAQEMTVQDLDINVYGDDNGNDDATDGTDDDTSDNDGLINTGSVGNLTDIKIVNVDTGAVLMGPLELDYTAIANETEDVLNTPDNTQTIDFTDDFSMEAGETLNLAVVADIDDAVTSGTEFAAAVVVSQFVAEDVNGDTIAAANIVPSANVVGYNHEAVSASVTFALASAPTSTTLVQGRTGAEMLGLTVTTGDASDVLVNAMTFTAYGDNTNVSAMELGGNTGYQVEDYLSSCTLYNGDDALSSPKSPTSAGDIVFSSLNWTVAAGSTELLSVVCNVSNTSDVDTDDVVALDLQTGDVTAQNEDGVSVTPTLTVVGGSATGINDSSNDATFDALVGMTIAPSGTIAALASSGTPSADFLLTGSSSNYVGEFTFTATNEDFSIDKLVVEEVSAGEFGASATAYSNNISLVTITYPDSTGATATKTAAMSSAKATFSGLDFLVDINDESNVKVYVNVPSSDRNSGGSATSNERVEVALSSTAGDFNAVGADSGTADTAVAGSDVDTDKVFVVRETKPTVSLSSSSPSGSKTPGNQEVYRFNVAANSNEDVVLSELVWKMSSTDNSGTPIVWNDCDLDLTDPDVTTAADFSFYNLSEEGTTLDLDGAAYSLLKTTGAACDNTSADLGFVHLTLPVAEIVPAGQTYTYSLWYNASRVSAANDDTLQFELQGDLLSNATMQSAGGNATATATATALTMSANVDAAVTPGDVLKAGTEYMLLVEESGAGDDLSVIRGYLGTTPIVHAGAAVTRLPSGFLWQDDGTITFGSTTGYGALLEYWGANLVDNLSVTGGTIAF